MFKKILTKSSSLVGLAVGTAVSMTGATSFAAYDTVSAQTFSQLCPDWIGGDRDYNDNGPEVTSFMGLGRFNGSQIWFRAEMHQIETVSDWTESDLQRWFKLTERTDGTQYTHVWAPVGGTWGWQTLNDNVYYNTWNDFYVDQNWNVITKFPTNFWIDYVKTMGDTANWDVGNCTSDDAYMTPRLNTTYYWFQ